MITKVQIKHRFRLIRQFFNKNIAIVGGYHGGNLGDMALGISVKNQLKHHLKRNGVLQTIYSLNRLPWRKCKYAILGGGAIGYEDSLKQIYTKYCDNFEKIAFLGVDFNDNNYSQDTINILKQASWLSCRNEQQRIKLQNLSGRKDVGRHPDLAFSLYPKICKNYRGKEDKKKLLLINVVPLYSSIKNGQLIPAIQYKNERPELFDHYDTMISAYIEGVKELVKHYQSIGYKVESIPFTPQDDEMAKLIFSNNEISFVSYTDNPIKMFEKMSAAEVIFSTRYHATIFALKVGANLIPFAYAKKNEELLHELGVKSHQFLTAKDLAYGKNRFPDALKVANNIIDRWEENTIVAINNCFKRLFN